MLQSDCVIDSRHFGGTKCNGHKRKNVERTRNVRLPFEAGNVRGYS